LIARKLLSNIVIIILLREGIVLSKNEYKKAAAFTSILMKKQPVLYRALSKGTAIASEQETQPKQTVAGMRFALIRRSTVLWCP